MHKINLSSPFDKTLLDVKAITTLVIFIPAEYDFSYIKNFFISLLSASIKLSKWKIPFELQIIELLLFIIIKLLQLMSGISILIDKQLFNVLIMNFSLEDIIILIFLLYVEISETQLFSEFIIYNCSKSYLL